MRLPGALAPSARGRRLLRRLRAQRIRTLSSTRAISSQTWTQSAQTRRVRSQELWQTRRTRSTRALAFSRMTTLCSAWLPLRPARVASRLRPPLPSHRARQALTALARWLKLPRMPKGCRRRRLTQLRVQLGRRDRTSQRPTVQQVSSLQRRAQANCWCCRPLHLLPPQQPRRPRTLRTSRYRVRRSQVRMGPCQWRPLAVWRP